MVLEVLDDVVEDDVVVDDVVVVVVVPNPPVHSIISTSAIERVPADIKSVMYIR